MLYKFDIIIHPSEPEPAPLQKQDLRRGKIWNWPWRINMLALPKRPIGKYTPPPMKEPKIFEPMDPNVVFRSDHLARPIIRTLYENRRLFSFKGPKYVARMSKYLDKSWDAIYNYYNKRLRNRRLKKLKRLQAKRQAKKLKGKDSAKWKAERLEHNLKLATPKKLFLPRPIKRKRVQLEDLFPNLDKLASPKEREVIPPRPLPNIVSESAMKYEITEPVMRLYITRPQRVTKKPSDPIVPGVVSKAALRAKCSPRVEKLAQPSSSAREAKKNAEEAWDPWFISRTALKYKPTPRILELAKPLERE